MARITITHIFALFVFACFVNMAVSFDLGEYIEKRLRENIEKYHLTCDNYEEFCEKNAEEGKTGTSMEPSQESTDLALELCKDTYGALVCMNIFAKVTTLLSKIF